MTNRKKTTNSPIKKVLSAIGTGILIFSMLLCIIVVFKTTMGGEPSVFGYRTFYIVSGSMGDTLPVGTTIIVHKQSSYEVKDIITFEAQSGEIKGEANTHRIVDITVENGVTYYTTKGDANNACDADKITDADIYGKMVFSTGNTEWLSSLITFMTTPKGFFFIIGIPILIFALLSMKDFIKNYKNGIKEKVMEELKKQNPEVYNNLQENTKENPEENLKETPSEDSTKTRK